MNNTTPKFRTKLGEPTVYGFACGHIMSAENETTNYTDNGKRVTLEMECGIYHVKAIDWTKRVAAKDEPETKGWNDSVKFRVWRTFENVKSAKRAFRAECKRLGLKYKREV